MPVRRATAADIALILQLERESPMAAHWPEPHYRSIFSGGNRLAWMIDDAGFLIVHHIAGEWEVENILVSPSVQRQGFATALMETFLATARQWDSSFVFLEVRESNQPARAFYEKLGFRSSGRRAGYYRNPDEDALTYRLDL